MEQTNETALLRDRYTVALLNGDHEEASRIVGDAISRGINASAIYFEMFGPTLSDIGDAWHRGELNIAVEHLATSVTLQQIGYVRDSVQRKRDIGTRAVVASVEGEMHSVGALMIANVLHLEGWDVAVLGQNTPNYDLVEFVRQREPDVVVLSLSHPDRIQAASSATTMLKSLDTAPVVFVGGAGLLASQGRSEIPADLVSSDPQEAVRSAGELLGLDKTSMTLEDHLSAIGRRVQQERRDRGWSQQELSSRTGLDRTYLSTVEQGKQNITIGAAVRIAHALVCRCQC